MRKWVLGKTTVLPARVYLFLTKAVKTELEAVAGQVTDLTAKDQSKYIVTCKIQILSENGIFENLYVT